MATSHNNSPNALLAARRREAAKPGRNKMSGRGSGLTPRVKRAIELLVFGREDDLGAVVRLQHAAELAGMKARALRYAMLKPAVDAFYQQQLIALRNGERAQSIRTIAEVRDASGLKDTAAGQTARLKAAEMLAFDRPSHVVNVNTQFNLSGERRVTPGYVIDLRDDKTRPGVHTSHSTVGGLIVDDPAADPKVIEHVEHQRDEP